MRGVTEKIADESDGTRPYTHGVTLTVFYVGGGAEERMLLSCIHLCNTHSDADAAATTAPSAGINSERAARFV